MTKYCLLVCLVLTACASPVGPVAPLKVDTSRVVRLDTGAAMPLPAQTITRILSGSCLNEEKAAPDPILAAIHSESSNLFLMLGDNVYGDVHNGRYRKDDSSLTGLRASMMTLAKRDDFRRLRQRHPMMVTWDDHDFGRNDAGGDFPYKQLAESLHESFWGLDKTEVGQRPGVYYSRRFGENGRRTQVIMLDTRFFRTPLTKTNQRGAKGKERYLPSQDPDQDMLGSAQWRWLAQTLQEPADLRIIASSVQVLPADHGWESWSRLPASRAKLLEMLANNGARAVVLLSGDRHHAFLYRSQIGDTTLIEMTTSAVNQSFRHRMQGKDTRERDKLQTSPGYSGPNYGSVQIDWGSRRVKLSIQNEKREVVHSLFQAF